MHITRCDDPSYLSFARQLLRSLSGVKNGTVTKLIGDVTVTVKKVFGHEYVTIARGGGVGYEFFTTGDKQSHEYIVGWQPLTDAKYDPSQPAITLASGVSLNEGCYRGYSVKVTCTNGVFTATPLGSTIEKSPEGKWPYSTDWRMSGAYMWSRGWQIQGITEPVYISKNVKLPTLESTWGALTGYHSYGIQNPTTLRRISVDIDFDAKPKKISKQIPKTSIKALSYPEGTDWYRRAGICVKDGRFFIVLTDCNNDLWVYPDSAPRDENQPKMVPSKYVRKIAIELPPWNNNNTRGAHDAKFVNWAFNGDCTKFAGIVERKVWEPTDTEGFHIANGLGGSGRVICGGLVLAHGWAEYRLDISVTGERLEDFTVTVARERDEDPLQSGLQTLDINYAAGVFVPKKEDDKPPCGWKEDDLLLMQVGLYESKKFEVNPTWGGGKFDWSNLLNEWGNGVADYRAIPDIDSALRGSMMLPPPKFYFDMHLTGLRAQYVKTVVTVKNMTTGSMLRTFTLGEHRDATSFFATRIVSWDLRAMAFLVTVQVLRGTSGEPLERGRSWYEWVGDGAPVTEGLTQSVDFIGMQSYQSRERVYNTGGDRVELRNEFATGMLVAVLIGNELDESTRWLGDDYARDRAESILATKTTPLTPHQRDAHDRGVYTSNWLLHAVTTYCDPLEQDKFQIDKSGSWSLATMPFTTSNYASVGNIGTAVNHDKYVVTQCVIDVIAIKNGAKWARTTHREMFNQAYGKKLTEADLHQVPKVVDYPEMGSWGMTGFGWEMRPPRCSEVLYYPHDASNNQRFLFPDYLRSIGACARVGRPGLVAERSITPSGFTPSAFAGNEPGDGCYQTTTSHMFYRSVDFRYPTHVFQSKDAVDNFYWVTKTLHIEYPHLAGSRLFTS